MNKEIFLTHNFNRENYQYLVCKDCNLIVFNDETRNKDLYFVSGRNKDMGGARIEKMTCDEVIIKDIIE